MAPILLAIYRPGEFTTRTVIAIAQVSFSSLLIHLTGGRIETHFHVFGSLAFLSFYRDWRVFVPATSIIAIDHLVRGFFWPESVFGVLTAAPWRALEHAGWVIFEDIFLIWGCLKSKSELHEMSSAQARLEFSKDTIEHEVETRTRELKQRTLELEESLEKGHQLEVKLSEAQKLESLGQLAAGIAHEINTPMQYIGDNIEFLHECSQKLLDVVAIYHHNLHEKVPAKPWAERIQEIDDLYNKLRFDFVQKQVPLAIEEATEGVDRVIEIVQAMKQLSHPGGKDKVCTDINQAIQSSVTVTKNQWKYTAEMELECDQGLPAIPVFAAEINQVFVNLIVNASDAICEKHGENNHKGKIAIRTYSTEKYVVIEIRDDGCGMTEEVRRRIFEPFFTTKEVGKGTGQGLAISFNVVVTMHQGELDVLTKQGEGTCFTIRLPICLEEQEGEELAPVSSSESKDSETIIFT